MTGRDVKEPKADIVQTQAVFPDRDSGFYVLSLDDWGVIKVCLTLMDEV